MQTKKNFNVLVNDCFVQIEMSNQQSPQIQLLIADCDSNRIYQLKINHEEFQSKFKSDVFHSLQNLYYFFEQHRNEREKISVEKQGKIIFTTDTDMSKEHNKNTFVLQALQITTNPDHKEPIQTSNYENESEILAGENQKSRQQIICQKAAFLLRMGIDIPTLAKHLKISQQTCHKMKEQFKKFGKIIPPKRQTNTKRMSKQQGDRPKHLQQQAITLSPVTPNMKIQGPIVQKIRHILYQLVQQGKMTTLEQMQQYLIQFNVWRSLSSIYRYVANIKAEHKQFQGRCYAMHRKNSNTLVTNTIVRRR